MPTNKQNELSVITKAKDLCSYIMIITQKSPKHFRFTFVTRMQNLCLDIIEAIYMANEILKGDVTAMQKRLEYQWLAMTKLRILAYFSLLAMEQKCILLKQYEQISKQTFDCLNLLGAWINSDRRRFG